MYISISLALFNQFHFLKRLQDHVTSVKLKYKCLFTYLSDNNGMSPSAGDGNCKKQKQKIKSHKHE